MSIAERKGKVKMLVQPGGNSERGYDRIKGGKEARSVLRCPIRKRADLM
jgi:hypothetical protein